MPEKRLLQVETVLGKDTFELVAFRGEEGVSQLYHFDLQLIADDKTITAKSLLGTNATFWVLSDEEAPIYFNGIVSHFQAAELADWKSRVYHIRLVPNLWLLTRRAGLKIWQSKSVLDIATDILANAGITDIAKETTGSYDPYDFKVQYRESDFAFFSRLLEQEGIFYFFRHENGKHKLVLSDFRTSFQAGAEAELTFSSQPAHLTVHRWQHEYEIQTGTWTTNDFNFETPTTDLTSTTPTTIDPMKGYEVYDYPHGYDKKAAGDKLTRARMEGEEAAYHIIDGESSAGSIRAGTSFTLKDHPLTAENIKVALTWVSHSGIDEGTERAGARRQEYRNIFRAITADQAYHPPRTTPRPIVRGPQTAFVVGPSGEEIYCDKYGRVKVQFHWDRDGKQDDKSSFWIRVAQSWAGKQWGSQIIPRVNMEVIVEFLEGDPDRPIITGCVPNADTMPPYTLPDEMTKSVFRTNSSKGGGGYHEFTFEDKKGSEEIFLHSEKDFDWRVKNDSKEWVGNDRHLYVKMNRYETIDGESHLKLKTDLKHDVGGTVSMNAETDMHYKSGQNFAIKGGMNVAIEAGQMLSLKVGGNFISIGPSGVTITGTMVMINSGGSAGSLTADPKPPTAAKDADDRTAGAANTIAGIAAAAAAAVSIVATKVEDDLQAVQVASLLDAAAAGKPFCPLCAAAGAVKDALGL